MAGQPTPWKSVSTYISLIWFKIILFICRRVPSSLITCPCDFTLLIKCFDYEQKEMWSCKTDMYLYFFFLLISSHASCLMLIIKESSASLYKTLMYFFSIFCFFFFILLLLHRRAFAVKRHKCCVRFLFRWEAKTEWKEIMHYWKTQAQEKERKKRENSVLCRLTRFADFHIIFNSFISWVSLFFRCLC